MERNTNKFKNIIINTYKDLIEDKMDKIKEECVNIHMRREEAKELIVIIRHLLKSIPNGIKEEKYEKLLELLEVLEGGGK